MTTKPTWKESAVRVWCLAIARTLEVRHIHPGGMPYLDRYTLAGWSHSSPNSPGALYLHHFLASDPNDQVHSHPWSWSASLVLAGGYREERCDVYGNRTVREYRPGDVNLLEADVRHRIDLLAADCWTLFLAGDFEQPWRFGPSC